MPPRKKKTEETTEVLFTKPTAVESVTLYDGAVELTFDPVKHKYFANGELVQGVTTLLKVINKPALVGWSAKMAGEYVLANLRPGVPLNDVEIKQLAEGAKSAHRVRTEKAADVGSLAHQWCEDYVKGLKPATPVHEDLRAITDAFLRFLDEYDIEPIRAERKLYSRNLKAAGTTDLIAMFQGGLAILDYKTSASGIWNEAFIQLGAYSTMYAEETGQQADVHVVVNVNKKGELNVGICEKVARSEEAFFHAVELNRALAAVERDRKEMIRRVA
jgi:hypothetical protein